MLLSGPHSAEKFSPIPGLRSLLVVPDGAPGVVTRAVVALASPRGRGGEDVHGSRDVASINDEEKDMKAKEEEGEEKNIYMDDEEGCWVSYGRRCRRNWLPPPIPSLVARGALRRTRTDDGRLVIRMVPVVRPGCIRAWCRAGRLTMQFVEREDESAFTATPLPAPISAREDDTTLQVDDDRAATAVGEGVDDGTAAPVIGEDVDDVQEEVAAPEMLPAVPPPRMPSVGCFEDVFNCSSIASSSLHQIPSLRMVH